MHIVQCLTQSDRGGGQVAVFNLVRSLCREYPNVRMTVALPRGGVFIRHFKSLGVDVQEFGFNKISFSSFRMIVPFLRELRPDVVHSHGKGAGLYVRSISRAHLPALRFHSYHGFHPPHHAAASSLYLSLESFLLGKTDKLIAVSPSEADELRRLFPGSGGKITMVPNVVDAEQVSRDAKMPLSTSVEKFLDANKNCHIVTMVARDDAVKDYPLAISSAGQVLEKKNNVAFIFIGVSEYGKEFRRLRDLSSGRVLGLSFHDSPAAVVERSHCVLLTSKKEGGLPLVIQEAFCLGKPVVATDVEGIRDLVRNKENGLLCEQTAGSLSSAILELTKDDALYAKLSQGARDSSRSFDQRTWAHRYYELYQK
ncbi:MAG TPA: glycosyltransferase family 4 protein [Bacteroidota bacterium]|nr:glycosyltransferase family 4 protein [Bacteroidota bacterium]